MPWETKASSNKKNGPKVTFVARVDRKVDESIRLYAGKSENPVVLARVIIYPVQTISREGSWQHENPQRLHAELRETG
jgi:hypothetical protein